MSSSKTGTNKFEYKPLALQFNEVLNFIKNSKFLMKSIELKVQEFLYNYKKNGESSELILAPITIILLFNLKLPTKNSDHITRLLINEPIQFNFIVKNCVHFIINSILKTVNISADLEQIHARIRFKEFEYNKKLLFNPFSNLFRKGLSTLHCILSSYTINEKYILQSTWCCPNKCFGNVITGQTEKPPSCLKCFKDMIEYTKLRCMSNHSFVNVIPFESLKTPNMQNKIFRSIQVRISDDLYQEQYDLGEEYLICGVYNLFSKYFEAWKLQKVNYFSEAYTSETDHNSLTSDHPFDNEKINSQLESNIREEQVIINSSKKESDENNIFLNTTQIPNFIEWSKAIIQEYSSTQNKVSVRNSYCSINLSQNILKNSRVKLSKLNENYSIDLFESTNTDFFINLNKSKNQFPNDFQTRNIYHDNSLAESNTLFRQAENNENSNKKISNLFSQISTTPIFDNLENNENKLHVNSVSLLSGDSPLIPKSIWNLKEVLNIYSDFTFVYALSAQMCQNVLPMNYYIDLKISLLLSIASIDVNSTYTPIPILGIIQDTTSANLIMNTFGNIARRFLTPLDDFSSGKLFKNTLIEAGSVILAKSGVCFFGDWSRLKSSNSLKILKDIELGYVCIENSTMQYPIQCAQWSHWSPKLQSSKDLQKLNILSEIFGIPVLCDESQSDILINFLLDYSSLEINDTDATDCLNISESDMKQFLFKIANKKVKMTSEAEGILQRYFVTSRKDQPNGLSKKAFASLRQFAESFAKISLRQNVIKIDAIGAIYIAENYIRNIHGPGIYPSPIPLKSNSIEDINIYIKSFETWLDAYLNIFY